MTPFTTQGRLHTTREFDRWWEAEGRVGAVHCNLDPDAARALAWEAWRKGREQMREATAAERLQPAPSR